MIPQTFSYGPSTDETLDVFGGVASNAPIHVHIHGGAWPSPTNNDASLLAPVFANRGALYITLNFSVIPMARLPEIIAQTQRAIIWIYENAFRLGGDANRIHISGHSAGAHMASVLLITNWSARFNLPSDVLKSGVLISGYYDLEPVMLSPRKAYDKLSREEQLMLSPIRHPEQISAPLIIAFGDDDPEDLRRQASRFVEVLNEASKAVMLVQVANSNHLKIMEVFSNPASELTQMALRLLTPPAEF